MGLSAFYRSLYQYKSVSLRNNERFVRLHDEATEAARLYFERRGVFDDLPDDVQDVLQSFGPIDIQIYTSEWETFQDNIRNVDQLLKRVEKNASFSEVLAGIMPQIEQKIFTVLGNFWCCFEGLYYVKYNLRTGRVDLDQQYLVKDLLEVFAESVSSGLESAYELAVSALVLLSFVYQYLIGCVDKGGSKTYSPGSFLFRLIFVAIVLFLGSYVWIKSRPASYTANRRKRKSCPLADRASQLGAESDVPEGVYRRAVKDTSGSITHYKYEPRFKPRREKLESGTSLEFNCLSLGSCDTPREAEIVRHIAVALYGKEEGRPVQFEDGLGLPFPSVSEQEKCPPSGKAKADWVTHKTKQLYADLLREEARRLQQLHPTVETGSHHGHHDGEPSRSNPSPSALGAYSTTLELTCFTSPHGGNGVVEQPTTSEPHGLGQESLLAREVFPAFFSDSDLEQIFRSMPRLKENDLPAMDDLDTVVGDNSQTDRVFGFEFTSVPPQSSALDNPTTAIFGSRPQLGGGGQGLEIIEPRLNSATAIPFQQLESSPEQVQFQVCTTCQEKRPEEYSESNVEWQHKLLESEIRISELEQKLRQSEVENEKWRSMFHQVAKLMSASNLDRRPLGIQ